MKLFALVNRVWGSAVAWAIVVNAIRVGGLVFVLPLQARHLPSTHLGLWYVFINLGSLALLADAGFAPTVSRCASYLWGGATEILPFGVANVSGEPGRKSEPNLGLLEKLAHTMRWFYLALAAVMGVLLVFGGGAWIWSKTAGLEGMTGLRAAWLFYSAGCVVNIAGSLWPALLTGIGGVRQAQQILAIGTGCNYAITATGLVCGAGLWSAVAGNVFAGIFVRSAGRAKYFSFSGTRHLPGRGAVSWSLLRCMWPTAWRTGLVTLGGFLIVNANTLTCSRHLGLAATASYGLSLQCVGAVGGLCAVWVLMKLPEIGRLRATGNHGAIARLFASRMRLVILCYAAGAAVMLLAGSRFLELIHAKSTLLNKPTLAIMLLVTGLEMHHSLYGSLVLTENRNPFVMPALVSGFCVAVGGWLFAPQFGYWGLLLSQGLVQAAFNNWWTVWRGLQGLGISFPQFMRLVIFLPARSR